MASISLLRNYFHNFPLLFLIFRSILPIFILLSSARYAGCQNSCIHPQLNNLNSSEVRVQENMFESVHFSKLKFIFRRTLLIYSYSFAYASQFHIQYPPLAYLAVCSCNLYLFLCAPYHFRICSLYSYFKRQNFYLI